jgi:hypothetical protein
MEDVAARVRQHIQAFFSGHGYEEHVWTLGPAVERFPNLRIAELSPGPRANLWVYVTVGAWDVNLDSGSCLEFLITAPEQDLRHVELLTMTVYYHQTRTLGLGHTFPIGEPWLPGSLCDHMLVSLPYPFGPELEICNLEDGHVHLLWLLPITAKERTFKAENGQEELERRFDEAGIQFANPFRTSVV